MFFEGTRLWQTLKPVGRETGCAWTFKPGQIVVGPRPGKRLEGIDELIAESHSSAGAVDKFMRTFRRELQAKASETGAVRSSEGETAKDGNLLEFHFSYTAGEAKGEVAAWLKSERIDDREGRRYVLYVTFIESVD